MIKKTITYTDYDGVNRTETFWFHMSKPELLKMTSSANGRIDQKLRTAVEKQDDQEMYEFIESFICNAYGEKSLDGKRFQKSNEISEAFKQTEAYSELFMSLISDPDAFFAFMKGVLPADMAAQVTEKIPDLESAQKMLLEADK